MRSNPEPYVQKSFIVDPSDVKERPPERPAVTTWHHELVGARLVEAAGTIRRMPMNTRPREYGGMWPSFNAMSPSELVGFENELLASGGQGALDAWRREQNRVRTQPSAKEIERAEQALAWVIRYLGHDKETAQIVGYWADKTHDLEDEIPPPVRTGLRAISRGLRQDRVPVRA